MFEYRKRRRQLLRQREELNKQVESQLVEMKDKRPEEVSLTGLVTSDYQTRLKRLNMEFEILDADRLLKKADKWGVERSASKEGYQINPSTEPRYYFRPQQKEQMRKMISDARRKRIKEWIDIISPVATVVISLLALILSIIALYRSWN